MTNAEKIKEMCDTPEIIAKFLFERDCNCWECLYSPNHCNGNCLENMIKFMIEEYKGQYD